ncbi:MAG: hypothetical protein RIB78_04885 [Gammaproteobacteria bacterium]
MKHTFIVIGFLTLFTVSAFSAEMHDHNMDTKSMNTQIEKSQSTDLQVQMEKMTGLMERIKSEQNPETREQLTKEHMATMQHAMQMMNDNMNKNFQPKSMDSDKRMDMMNHNMEMMQQMMQQMKGMSGGMGHM